MHAYALHQVMLQPKLCQHTSLPCADLMSPGGAALTSMTFTSSGRQPFIYMRSASQLERSPNTSRCATCTSNGVAAWSAPCHCHLWRAVAAYGRPLQPMAGHCRLWQASACHMAHRFHNTTDARAQGSPAPMHVRRHLFATRQRRVTLCGTPFVLPSPTHPAPCAPLHLSATGSLRNLGASKHQSSCVHVHTGCLGYHQLCVTMLQASICHKSPTRAIICHNLGVIMSAARQ